MSKRKNRSRRTDTRTMDREEYVKRWVRRYKASRVVTDKPYEAKHGDSPYTSIERLQR